ncbi:MAG TPA: hypothetical protein VLS51_03605 [Propionibacteriaceae bacterium]|nr:hypothetical protein [Propionibacteriaceae bacterium]
MDGSGALGIAVLATLRDDGGNGPGARWSGPLVGPAGSAAGDFAYFAPGAGSWVAAWWPGDPAYAGAYSLELSDGSGATMVTGFDLGSGVGLPPPEPTWTEATSTLTWGQVPGAAAYECRVLGADGVSRAWLGSGTTCDMGALGEGAYTASVIAYSADLPSLAASGEMAPLLPERFDVSEARLAFARNGATAPAGRLAAAAGTWHDGTDWTGKGLALWVSILDADGAPATTPWSVEVVGPGMPPATPLTFAYPAGYSRIMVWTSAILAVPGSYGVVARSASGALAVPLTLVTLASMEAPSGIVAHDGAQGSAAVDWTAVAGAASYLITVRRQDTGAFVTSQWVATNTAAFPAGTFVAGATYDAVVAATSADMAGGAVPTQLAITENSFQPASFTAR